MYPNVAYRPLLAGPASGRAMLVLHRWADPNNNPNGSHQCYADQQNQVVPYPPPPEPTY